MKKYKMEIPDMQSAHCQMRVQNAIQSLGGLNEYNIQPGRLEVSFENESGMQHVKEAIEKAGYSVLNIAEHRETPHIDQTYQFKTNMHCEGCVEKVRSSLDEAAGICHWGYNFPEQTLTVHSEGISPDEIMSRVRASGFRIEEMFI
jgi:copper chaperone